MGRHFGEVSTISTTARQPRCCTHSTPQPAWSSSISTSPTNPTTFPPHGSCSANFRLPTASSLSMPCIAEKTFEVAAQVRAQLLVQLKDNQPTLLQSVEAACASRQPTGSDSEVTTGRNRHETRTVDVFSATRAVAGTDWQPLIKRIVRVTRNILHRDAKTGLWSSTSEVAFYLANSSVSARLAAHAIRHHWHVENTLHSTRDVTFQEDRSRIRHNPGIFARVRSFAYNVLCCSQTSTSSQDRYAAALAGFDALGTWRFS
jgi:predicted transposase YbfD/YdcC